MNPCDQHAEEILATAMEIADPVARRAYLDGGSARNAALRQEVKSLLATHEQAGDFMKTTVLSGSTTVVPTEHAGGRIGRCKPLERISEGGFGIVWMTNLSVNQARSTGPALFVGGWALQQLWLFWVAPVLGAVLAGVVYPFMAGPADEKGS